MASAAPSSRRRQARGFRIFDATCPLVSKVHVEVAKLHREGFEFIMIGHKGHPEVEGTMGQVDDGSIHLVEDVADVARIAHRSRPPSWRW
jgi:4-hydroxy-3-methylbut-2-enyl diphosphate reductase